MTVENLTLSEIRAAREDCENAIAIAIKEFYTKTNMRIEAVEIENVKAKYIGFTDFKIIHQEVHAKTEPI